MLVLLTTSTHIPLVCKVCPLHIDTNAETTWLTHALHVFNPSSRFHKCEAVAMLGRSDIVCPAYIEWL